MSAVPSSSVISAEFFSKRLARLCLAGGTWSLPKSVQDRQILMKSMQLLFNAARDYSEKEVNQLLEAWLSDVAPALDSDHVILRRLLVDHGYLVRSSDGGVYRVGPGGSDFEAAVSHVDPVRIMQDARAAEAERKKAHTGGAGRS
jgi:hypothetical protein